MIIPKSLFFVKGISCFCPITTVVVCQDFDHAHQGIVILLVERWTQASWWVPERITVSERARSASLKRASGYGVMKANFRLVVVDSFGQIRSGCRGVVT
eukprot:852413-Amorphochlora_amoeboformis.AAC.1